MANVPISNMTVTWTDSGTTYNAVKMNVTDTASNAASLLMDLQVGGTSKFKASKTGVLTLNNSGTVTWTSADDLTFSSASAYQRVKAYSFWSSNLSAGIGDNGTAGQAAVHLGSTASIGWTSSVVINATTYDTFIGRKAAANIRLGNADVAAPVAQTLSVQSVVAGTTNIAGTDLTITGSQGTGTGAGGKITFSAANAGTSGSTQNPLVDRMRISGIDANTALFEINSNGGYVNFTATGNTLAIATGGGSSNNHDVQLPGLTSYRLGQGYGIAIGTGASMPVLQGGVQEDSDALAQRRATNPQAFRVYNTYTNSTNYERANISWETNELVIGTQVLGTGVERNIRFRRGATSYFGLNITNAIWNINPSGHFTAGTDNTHDIGASGANRPRSIYVGSNVVLPVGGGSSVQWESRSRIYGGATDGVIALSNAAFTGFSLLQFGGTTSSFPALKRNTTALETKLADDSAYAPHAMQYLDVTDGITAPGAATGRARIYVDTADGDLKVVFADGTVKTIVTDT